jgi:hypothetical protein
MAYSLGILVPVGARVSKALVSVMMSFGQAMLDSSGLKTNTDVIASFMFAKGLSQMTSKYQLILLSGR